MKKRNLPLAVLISFVFGGVGLLWGCEKPSGNWTELMEQGRLAMKGGDFKEAEKKFSTASAIAEQKGPKNDRFTRSISALGAVYLEQSRFDEAVTFFKRAFEIDKRIVKPDSPVLAEDLNDIGRAYMEEGNIARAKTYFVQALKIAESEHVKNKNKPIYVRILSNLATAVGYLEGYWEAREYVNTALDYSSRIKDKSAVLKTLGKLAAIVDGQGDYEEADRLYQEALKLEKDYYGEDSHLLVKTMSAASEFYRRAKQYEKSEQFGMEALALSNKYYGEKSKHSAMLLCHLGLLYGDKGDLKKSEEYLRSGIKLIEETLGEDHPELGLELINLGVELEEDKKLSEAEPVYQRAATVLENSVGSQNPHLARAYQGLARLYHDKKRQEDAEVYLNKAIKIQESVYGEESARLVSCLKFLKELKEANGDSLAVSALNARIERLESLKNAEN